MQCNIPGNDLTKGDEYVEYVGSGPPEGTALHRYVLLLFKQSSKVEGISKITNRSAGGRLNWNIRKLAAEKKLELVSGTFFQAQYDDSVPAIHKQINFTA